MCNYIIIEIVKTVLLYNVGGTVQEFTLTEASDHNLMISG